MLKTIFNMAFCAYAVRSQQYLTIYGGMFSCAFPLAVPFPPPLTVWEWDEFEDIPPVLGLDGSDVEPLQVLEALKWISSLD